MRKILGICVALTLFATLLASLTFASAATGNSMDIYDGVSVSERLEGSGVEGDPYLIRSGADLRFFVENSKSEPYISAHYLMTADIVWSSYDGDTASAPASSNWTPANDTTNDTDRKTSGFAGVFDGGGHYISGIYCKTTDADAGFFGSARGATIRNLTIKASFFNGDERIAAFVGCADDTTVENCVNYASVNGSGLSVAGFVGRNAGLRAGDIVINGCVNFGSITSTCTSNNACVGGFIGGCTVNNRALISSCVNYGTITAKKLYAGGIAGQLSSAIITDCMNAGDVTATRLVGGIVGHLSSEAGYSLRIENCLNTGSIRPTVNDSIANSNTQFSAILGNGKGDTAVVNGNTVVNCYSLAGSVIPPNGSNTPFFGVESYVDTTLGLTKTKSADFLRSPTAISDMGLDASKWAENCLVAEAWGYVTVKTGLVCYGNIELLPGASVRLVEGTSGIRFESELSMELYKWLADHYGSSLTIGTVICPTAYLASCDFTMKDVDAAGITPTGTARYANIVRTQWRKTDTERGVYTMGAALVNIKEANYDRSLSARSYIKVTVDGTDYFSYSNYNATDNSRTISGVATAALADTAASYTTEQRNILHTYNGTSPE